MRRGAVLKRGVLQLSCIIALLVAQHAALTHAVWHAYERMPARFHTDAGQVHDLAGQPLSPSGLCGFDLTFGEVLGGVYGACLAFIAADSGAEREVQPLHARQRRAGSRPFTRPSTFQSKYESERVGF
jgi:hypothetical protein